MSGSRSRQMKRSTACQAPGGADLWRRGGTLRLQTASRGAPGLPGLQLGAHGQPIFPASLGIDVRIAALLLDPGLRRRWHHHAIRVVSDGQDLIARERSAVELLGADQERDQRRYEDRN